MAGRIASTVGWAAVRISQLEAESAALRKSERSLIKRNYTLQRELDGLRDVVKRLGKMRLKPRGARVDRRRSSAVDAGSSDSVTG